MERMHKGGFDGSFYWLDTRHKKKGSSYNTFGRNQGTAEFAKDVGYYGKSIDVKKSIEIGQLNLVEKAAVYIINKAFPIREIEDNNFSISTYKKNQSQTCLDFLSEVNCDQIHPYSETDVLDIYFGHQDNHLKGIAYTIWQKDKIVGLVHGLTSIVGEDESYFQIDGISFDKSLTWRQKRKLISGVEEKIKEEQNCFSIMVPSTSTKENLLSLGYIPIMTQTYVMNEFKDNSHLGDKDKSKIILPLR